MRTGRGRFAAYIYGCDGAWTVRPRQLGPGLRCLGQLGVIRGADKLYMNFVLVSPPARAHVSRKIGDLSLPLCPFSLVYDYTDKWIYTYG